jgi:hypothetical protein
MRQISMLEATAVVGGQTAKVQIDDPIIAQKYRKNGSISSHNDHGVENGGRVITGHHFPVVHPSRRDDLATLGGGEENHWATSRKYTSLRQRNSSK